MSQSITRSPFTNPSPRIAANPNRFLSFKRRFRVLLQFSLVLGMALTHALRLIFVLGG